MNVKKKKSLNKEEKYWEEVEIRSKQIITNLIEVNLPVNITSENFDLEQDTDYLVLLRGDIVEYYHDYEESEEELPEVETVAEQAAMWYLRNMMKKMITYLVDYSCCDPSFFENLTQNQ